MNKIADMIMQNTNKRKESEYSFIMLRIYLQKGKRVDDGGNNLEEEEYRQMAKQSYANSLYASQNRSQRYSIQTNTFIYHFEQCFLNYMDGHSLSNKEHILCIYISFYCFGNYSYSLALLQKMHSKTCSFKELVYLKYVENAIKESLNNNFNSLCHTIQKHVSFSSLFKHQTKLDLMYDKIYKSSQEYYHIWKMLSNKEIGYFLYRQWKLG